MHPSRRDFHGDSCRLYVTTHSTEKTAHTEDSCRLYVTKDMIDRFSVVIINGTYMARSLTHDPTNFLILSFSITPKEQSLDLDETPPSSVVSLRIEDRTLKATVKSPNQLITEINQLMTTYALYLHQEKKVIDGFSIEDIYINLMPLPSLTETRPPLLSISEIRRHIRSFSDDIASSPRYRAANGIDPSTDITPKKC